MTAKRVEEIKQDPAKAEEQARMTDEAVEDLLRLQMAALERDGATKEEALMLLEKPADADMSQFHSIVKKLQEEVAAQTPDPTAATGPAVFRCKSQVHFNGKVYEKGDEIPVTEEQAAAIPWAVEKS